MTKQMWYVLTVLIVIVLLLASGHDSVACPSCKEGYRPGTTEALAGEGYSWSVLFMLAVPMAIVSTFTVVLVRRLKKVDRGEV